MPLLRFRSGATLALVSSLTAGALLAQSSGFALSIRGHLVVDEQFEASFMAVLGNPPIRKDIEAYTPAPPINGVDGNPILASRMSPFL